MRTPGIRVRTLLAGLVLVVLFLPLLSIVIARTIDNQIVRRTEEVLIAEAVVVGEAYRQLLHPQSALRSLSGPSIGDEPYHPFGPALDLRTAALLPPTKRSGTSSTTPNSAVTDALTPLLQRAVVRNLSGVRVLDRDGFVVASPLAQSGYSLAHLPEVRAAMNGRYAPEVRRRFSDEPPPSLSSLSRAAVIRLSIAVPVYADPRAEVNSGPPVIGVVYNSRTPLDRIEYLWQLRHDLYRPALVSIIVTLMIAAMIGSLIGRPLARLQRAAEGVANGHQEESLSVVGFAPQEVIALSESLSSMRAQLETRAEYVARFATNTAHELKTPLTSLRGAAELILDDPDMEPEQLRRFLSNIHKDAVRMDLLVQRILHLARIEASTPARKDIDLRIYLEGIVERYARHGETVRLSYDSNTVTLAHDPEQLDSLVSNLLDNAVRHGAGEPVDLMIRDAPDGTQLVVRDHGPPVSEAHSERIFERFYTTERKHGGTGLGLAIVRAIAEAHGGHVTVERHERGLSFVVRLPQGRRSG